MIAEFIGAKLLISPSTWVEFDYEIRKILHIDGIFVVLLKVPSGVISNENIIGVTDNGKARWKIERIIPEDMSSPYLDIEESANGVYAYNWSGIRVEADVYSGKILNKKITK